MVYIMLVVVSLKDFLPLDTKAFDIISYAAGDENSKMFLGCSEDYIESVAEQVKDESLRHTLSFGIGLHHAGLTTSDRDMYVH